MMKKLLVMFLAVMLLLTACGQSGSDQTAEAPTWQEQYDLGIRYLSEGNYQEAIIAFTAAIEIDPKQAPAFSGRGDAYFGMAQLSAIGDSIQFYTEAISDYLASVELDAEQPDVLVKLGNTYALTEDYTEAVDAFSSALTLDDSLTEAYIGRGDAYMAILEEMLEDYDDETDTAKPGLPEEIIELYEQAKGDYLSALELDDQIVELYEKVADIYLAMDDFDSAVEILEKGLERTGDESLRARLEALTKNRSRTVTVAGEVIENPVVYESTWMAYEEEYSYLNYYTADGVMAGTVAIMSYGIRFAEPIIVEMGRGEATISEVEYWGPEISLGFQELTGYFIFDEGYAEIAPDHDDGNGMLYRPNGPYVFIAS